MHQHNRAMKRLLRSLAVFSLLAFTAAPLAAETPAEKDARMKWFREARFGMFIHWGLYAITAGEWNGKPVQNLAEWIQSEAQIPVSEYTPLKDRFNPVQYDADALVRLAKDAGMKYIVITTKHHDGFVLWDSAHTEWDVASTPYQKDLIAPLAEACRKHGIKLCLYHSIMDWHHPDYGTQKPWRGNAANPAPDMDRYTAYLKAQLKELLTNYGDIGVLWFDGEWEDAWTHERGKDLYAYCRSLQPSLIVNNRVDKGRQGMAGMTKGAKYAGDFGTPEDQIPPRGLPGVDWEACMTMNGTWGYSKRHDQWKSPRSLIRDLIDIASKGGNLLLNVGPTAEGVIQEEAVDRLREFAAWMKLHAEAIHGTTANILPATPWGRCTVKKISTGQTRLYLHIFDWPKDGKLTVTGLPAPVSAAGCLTDSSIRPVWAQDQPGIVTVSLPATAPDPTASVITLDMDL